MALPPAVSDAPQTARSIGMGPAWAGLADVVDLASLAAGRCRHAYRMAADAVDHLIALMDALEVDTEDMEDGDDADHEPSLGAPENHPGRFHVDMDTRYHVGVRHHPLGDQTTWAAGQDDDTDALDQGESGAGYDLACDDEEFDDDGLSRAEDDSSDHEPSIGWPNDFEAHRGLTGAGYDETEPDEDREDDELGDDRDPEPIAWVFGPSRAEASSVGQARS